MIYVLAMLIPPLAIAIQKGPERKSFWINLILYLSIVGTVISQFHAVAVISGARAVEGYITDTRNSIIAELAVRAAS